MPDGVVGLAIVGVPAAGCQVQPGDEGRLLVQEASAEDVGEQMVVAVPAPLVVQGDKEHVGAFELLEGASAVIAAGECVTQRAAESVQDGGVQEELPYLLGLAGED